MEIQLKRVYDEPSATDGFRILVDRLWPRGLKKDSLKADLWAKDIAPSAELRRWFHADVSRRWEAFADLYMTELKSSPSAAELRKTLAAHGKVTLLYAAKDTSHSHALVLKKFLAEPQ